MLTEPLNGISNLTDGAVGATQWKGRPRLLAFMVFELECF